MCPALLPITLPRGRMSGSGSGVDRVLPWGVGQRLALGLGIDSDTDPDTDGERGEALGCAARVAISGAAVGIGIGSRFGDLTKAVGLLGLMALESIPIPTPTPMGKGGRHWAVPTALLLGFGFYGRTAMPARLADWRSGPSLHASGSRWRNASSR